MRIWGKRIVVRNRIAIEEKRQRGEISSHDILKINEKKTEEYERNMQKRMNGGWWKKVHGGRHGIERHTMYRGRQAPQVIKGRVSGASFMNGV